MLRSALLNVMMQAARKAGRTLKRDFGEVEHLQVSLKGPANFVTAADRRAEEILYQELTKARPGYGFLGEEGGRRLRIAASRQRRLDAVPQGVRGDTGQGRGPAPFWRGHARSRLGGRGPAGWLLGTRHFAVGHGGGPSPRARGRRLRHRHGRRR